MSENQDSNKFCVPRVKAKQKKSTKINKHLSKVARKERTLLRIIKQLIIKDKTKEKRTPFFSVGLKLRNRNMLKHQKHKNKTNNIRKNKNESDKSTSSSVLEESENENTSSDCNNQDDDIRNKIKLQLELLRTKTKLHKNQDSAENEMDLNTNEIKSTKTNVNEVTNNVENIPMNETNPRTEIEVDKIEEPILDEQPNIEVEQIEEIALDTPELSDAENNDQPNKDNKIKVSSIILHNLTKDRIPTTTESITESNTLLPSKFTKNLIKLSKTSDCQNQKVVPLENQSISNSLENPMPSTSFASIELGNHKNTLTQNKNAAFVSDVLDSFLIENTDLKHTTYLNDEEVFPELAKTHNQSDSLRHSTQSNAASLNSMNALINQKTFKPKTLAEKRRMLEADCKIKILRDMRKREKMTMQLLKTCDILQIRVIAKDMKEKICNSETSVTREHWKVVNADKTGEQYAVVDGERICILGSTGGADIIIPPSKKRKIVKETRNEKCEELKLVDNDPRSLPKEQNFITNKESVQTWECHVLKMPKIKLVVYPEPGKPVPLLTEKYLQLCKSEDGKISDEWVQFAVSAVRCPKKSKTEVEFELPYANHQNELVVRKPKYVDKFQSVNVDNNIKDIMYEMLNCIENQELDKSIIKDDPDLSTLVKYTKDVHSPTPIKTIIKRSNKKRSKTALELRRLNVNIIEVGVEDNVQDVVEKCDKDFCRLGCICNSLRCVTSTPDHCGREKCILECDCVLSNRSQHAVKSSSGNNLLSTSTVVRLHDEAQRNLAKEERKFTQTVIKTNSQTIMVGDGARERRQVKVPKKYSNYVPKSTNSISYSEMIQTGLLEVNTEFDEDGNFIEYHTSKPKTGDIELKKPIPIWSKSLNDILNTDKVLRVTLDQLNLTNILPWCMVHNLYKCFCNGNTSFTISNPPFKQKPIQVTSRTSTRVSEHNYIQSDDELIEVSDETLCSSTTPLLNNYHSDETLCSSTTPLLNNFYIDETLLSRTTPLPNNYYITRNKSECFKARYAEMKKKEAEYPNPKLKEYLENNDRKLMPAKIDDTQVESKNVDLISKQKRTTQLQEQLIVQENNIEQQPSRCQQQQHQQEQDPVTEITNSSTSMIESEKSFQGLLAPSQKLFDQLRPFFRSNLGDSMVDQMRLFGWTFLVDRLQSQQIHVWFNAGQEENNVIITEDRRRPTKEHINISIFKNTTNLDKFKLDEIIICLLKNILPGGAEKSNETFVVLINTGTFWEARGTIILKYNNEISWIKLKNRPATYHLLEPQRQSERPNCLQLQQLDNNFKPCSNSAKDTEVINIADETLTVPEILTADPWKSGTITVPLPINGSLNRWFCLSLSQEFYVLRVTSTNLHIQYLHLLVAIKMATDHNKTVIIRQHNSNAESNANNSVGIYAIPMPEFRNYIFFGPYDNHSDHGLETFRYMNQQLYNTRNYNRMSGSANHNSPCGIWFIKYTTLNNKLSLKPQYVDNYNSINVATVVTSVDKSVKPHIEFVDLSETDSDSELSTQNMNIIDPIFHVLRADFSQRTSDNLTPVPVNYAVSDNGFSSSTIRNSTESTSSTSDKRKSTESTTITSTKCRSTATTSEKCTLLPVNDAVNDNGFSSSTIRNSTETTSSSSDKRKSTESTTITPTKLRSTPTTSENLTLLSVNDAVNDNEFSSITIRRSTESTSSTSDKRKSTESIITTQTKRSSTVTTNPAIPPEQHLSHKQPQKPIEDTPLVVTTASVQKKSTRNSVKKNTEDADWKYPTKISVTENTILTRSQTSKEVIKTNLDESLAHKRTMSEDIATVSNPKIPRLIDTIDLTDDDDDDNTNNTSNVTTPLNQPSIGSKVKTIFITTNIPKIGYFEVLKHNYYSYNLQINSNGLKLIRSFSSLHAVINWIFNGFYKNMFVYPQKTTIRFHIVQSYKRPNIPAFNNTLFNGNYLLCEKGVFNLLRFTANEMRQHGFKNEDITVLLKKKKELQAKFHSSISSNSCKDPEKMDKEKNLESTSTLNQQVHAPKRTETDAPNKDGQLSNLKTKPPKTSNATIFKKKSCNQLQTDASNLETVTVTTGKFKLLDGRAFIVPPSPSENLRAVTNAPVTPSNNPSTSKPSVYPVDLISTEKLRSTFAKRNFKQDLLIPIDGKKDKP